MSCIQAKGPPRRITGSCCKVRNGAQRLACLAASKAGEGGNGGRGGAGGEEKGKEEMTARATRQYGSEREETETERDRSEKQRDS